MLGFTDFENLLLVWDKHKKVGQANKSEMEMATFFTSMLILAADPDDV